MLSKGKAFYTKRSMDSHYTESQRSSKPLVKRKVLYQDNNQPKVTTVSAKFMRKGYSEVIQGE